MTDKGYPESRQAVKNRRYQRIFWSLIALLVFVCVPYAFMGMSEPRFYGLPVWFFVSLLASLMIAGLSIHKIWRHWD
jgi:hypothetical protein